MDIKAMPFGKTSAGAAVTRCVLTDGAYSASVIDYGAALQALTVPDRTGKPVDVVLGFDTAENYEQHDKYLGATVGRCANRIAGGMFTLGGKQYTVRTNDGANHLHGGGAFDKRVWRTRISQDGVTFSLTSANGDEGYPGVLETDVTYRLEDGVLTIDYRATGFSDTLCNLTNHAYFNLDGHDSGTVLTQRIRLEADRYTPIGEGAIPTGEIAPIDGTPMDLRTLRPIGQDIDADFAQLRLAGGFDHNWVVRGALGALRPCAEARSERTGITLDVLTTMPGVQFYTGNFLDGCPAGKDGAQYGKRSGFCLETQFYPDAIHHPLFPQPILHGGDVYRHRTEYRFSAE